MTLLQHDTTENKVTGLLLLLFAASLPFNRFYSQLLLLFLVVHTLIQLRTTRLRQVPAGTLLIQSSIWLLTVGGTVFSNYTQQAFPFWERQCALLLIPLCFYLLPFDAAQFRKQLMRVFVAVNCGVVLYLFQDAIRTMLFYRQPLSSLWSASYLSHNFAAPLVLHATYLSLFLSLAFCFSLETLLRARGSRTERALHIIASVTLAAGLLQLTSRAVLAATLLAAILLLPQSIREKRMRTRYWLLLASAALAGFFVLRAFPPLYDRLVTELGTDLGRERGAGLISDPRGRRWELAWQLIRQAPWLGHGSGSEVPLLRHSYFEHGLFDSYLNSLNAHNQYLSLLLRHGLAGMLCWLGTLAFFARRAYREKDILLGCFLLLVAVTSFSENILDVNKGIFFYAFFLAVLGNRQKNMANSRPASNPGHISIVRIRKEKLPS